jgi:RND family efflux transporter MFP subunit
MPSTLLGLIQSAGFTADRAPQHWVVAERHATEGQYVEVADMLYRLIVSDVVLLRAELAQRYSGQIAVGLPAVIDAAGATPREGRICRIHPMIDPVSRTYRVDVIVENRTDGADPARTGSRPDWSLTPGAFARLTITTRDYDDVVILPSTAVRSLAGVDTIFVVDPATRVVTARQIRVLARQTGEMIVQGALADGELVVRSVPAGLADGAAVELAETPPSTASATDAASAARGG